MIRERETIPSFLSFRYTRRQLGEKLEGMKDGKGGRLMFEITPLIELPLHPRLEEERRLGGKSKQTY